MHDIHVVYFRNGKKKPVSTQLLVISLTREQQICAKFV